MHAFHFLAIGNERSKLLPVDRTDDDSGDLHLYLTFLFIFLPIRRQGTGFHFLTYSSIFGINKNYMEYKRLDWHLSLLQENGKNEDQLNGDKESESGYDMYVGLGLVYHFLFLQ